MKELSPQSIRDCLCPLLCKHAEVQFAFLFGSYAKGRASRLNDIDIAVQVDWNLIGEIPPYGYKADFIADLMQCLHTNLVDLVVLNNAPILLKFHVLYHGQLMFCRDKAARIAFQVDTINRYQDFKHLRIPHHKAFTEKYRPVKND